MHVLVGILPTITAKRVVLPHGSGRSLWGASADPYTAHRVPLLIVCVGLDRIMHPILNTVHVV